MIQQLTSVQMREDQGPPTPSSAADKRREEAYMVSLMIGLWSRAHHSSGTVARPAPARPASDRGISMQHASVQETSQVLVGRHRVDLCPDCAELLAYAQTRIEHCPHFESKTFCSACPMHCYKPEMREKIREVMRWSGPRMLRYEPVLALRHAMVTLSVKRANRMGQTTHEQAIV